MKVSDFLPDHGLASAANLFGVVRRRLWARPGKAHIELPDLEDEEYDDFVHILGEELDALDGVVWAVPNGALGRMIVAFDEAKTGRDQVVAVVDEVEERFHLQEGLYCSERPSHPGDDEPLVRGAARLGASMVGAAAGTAMKLLGREPGRRRFDVAALLSVVDNVPHIRNAVGRRLGETVTNMSIGLANPLAQGIGSGPISPSLDVVHQLTQLFEVVERRQTWQRREPDLCARPERCEAPKRREKSRPIPIPNGPIEGYAEDAWNMSLGGFLVGLADTQQLESALTPVLDALPKPARYGRDAFAARLSRVLGSRDMVVLDPAALRRLDRIDCVIVDESLLITDRWQLDRIAGGAIPGLVEAFETAEQLLDPLHPEQHQRDGDWELKPARQVAFDPEWKSELRAEGARGDLLALTQGGEARALFSLRVVTDRASEMLVDAIHEAGLELIIAGKEIDRGIDFHANRVVDRQGLNRFIRHIQRDHQVIAYLGNGPQPAMDTADFAVGFSLRGAGVAWGADVLCGDNLDDGIFLIQAMTRARKVSKKCAALAGAGAGIGALSAIRGLEKTRPSRVMLAVNFASLIALIYGTAKARELDGDFQTLADPPAPWHRLDVDDVLSRVGSGVDGLGAEDVGQRETEGSEPAHRARRILGAIRRELANPLTPVLATGAAVSAAVGSLTDAGIVGTVIAFNGLVGGYERFRAEDRIDEMARSEALTVRVFRDGESRCVDSDELVVGDVIALESGDVVPADCRIIEAERLEVDESSLTGESLPVRKSAKPSFSQLVAQRSSMLYEGTAVVAGSTKAVVVALGESTEAGRSQWIGRQRVGEQVAGGVEARLERFSDLTMPVVGYSGGLLLSLGVFRRRELKELVGPAVNLAVGAVPEGLPLLATAAQLAASRRLVDRNVIVHNPRAMEALGRADILCIDKTGTLTQGTLQLRGVCDGQSHRDLSEDWDPIHHEICQIALRATPVQPENGILPHATDRAIADGANEHGVEVGDWTRWEQLPFKTELGFHATTGRAGSRSKVVIKGSPEEVLRRCTGRRSEGKWTRMSAAARQRLLERAQHLAGRGLRTLAVAQRRFRGERESLSADDIDGMTFYGFITLSDPLRPTAREAVRSLQKAGVSLLMLTGDHPETARRIARDVGIRGNRDIPTGDQIEAMDDEALAEFLLETSVIARMTPAHKVRIVQALQSVGKTVAMSGDGGNDAAALRFSDVGIALGTDSASGARDAADMVVTDARIGTIVDAVIEGRAMWRSVRDAVSILIGGNLGEVGFMVASAVVNTIPALNARQLLLVNLFTDVAPAMAIALRPPPDISFDELLHEGPEESLGEALENDILWRAAITATAGFMAWFVAQHSFQKSRSATVGLVAVVFAQLGQTLTAARPTLPVWAASLGSAAVLMALIETPGVSHLFGCRPLGPVGLSTALGSAAAATAASAIVPRLPRWKKAVEYRLGANDEPDPEDFFEDYYEAFSRP